MFESQGKGNGHGDYYERSTVRPVVVLKKDAIDTTSEYDGTTGWKLQ